MEVKVLSSEKNEMELEVGSVTVAEILRTYLNKDNSVSFAAWRREHHTDNPNLKVKTSGKTAEKAVKDSIKEITKDLDKVSSDFSKLK